MGMKQGTLTVDELIELCDKYKDHYESKIGDDYIDALSNVFKIKNRNDKPFVVREVMRQPTIDDFNFVGLKEFQYICELKAEPMYLDVFGVRIKNEKIMPRNFASKKAEDIFKNALGVAYMLTCVIDGKEHIVKFGQTRTPFKSRLGSYNCGVVNNWRTASTTNIKILQSFLATRLTYRLYIRDCSDDVVTFTWAGEKSVPFASPISLAIEDICMKKFVAKYGRPPLANVQANATEIDWED